MRVPLIAGNWKMNTNSIEALQLIMKMKSLLEPIAGVEKVICPPFISLEKVKDALGDSTIKIGAQNLFYEEKGAFTGEISPLMLRDLCEYVILGHSERRQYFHETNEIVNKKVKAALKVGLKPILCVGENIAEYEAGKTEEVVETQLEASLKDVNIANSIVIAYEPIWAIGTGKAATGDRANYVIGLIRKILADLSNDSISQIVRIVYGGSITADNIKEFISQPEIDGGLVGGASLKADQFVSIVKQTIQVKNS